MHNIEAKTILSAKSGMNLYRGCTPNEIPNYAFCPADEEILKKIIEAAT